MSAPKARRWYCDGEGTLIDIDEVVAVSITNPIDGGSVLLRGGARVGVYPSSAEEIGKMLYGKDTMR